MQHALLVRQWSDDVVFFAHTYALDAERAQLDARGIPVETGMVTKLIIDHDHLRGVEFDNDRAVARSAVFVRPGNCSHDDGLLVRLGCNIDSTEFVSVDATGRTSVSGVWAAGNVVEPRAQVITAAGAGSTTAIAINADLVEAEVEHAMSAAAAAGSSPRTPKIESVA